jgi:DNA modification methylase
MIKQLDCLEGLRQLESGSVNCIITSPPYNKKGLQKSPSVGNQIWGKFNIDYATYGDNMKEADYQNWMVEFLNECHRVLADDGSFFFNHKPRRYKNRAHLPTDFISRSDAQLYQLIIWDRRNSPNIRADCLVPCTEHVYWFCKSKPKVFRDAVDPQFKGEVWVINPERQKKHPAPFPETLVRNCILLSTQPGDTVLDPFMGSGTTAVVSKQLGREYLGFEIDPQYITMTEVRLSELAAAG